MYRDGSKASNTSSKTGSCIIAKSECTMMSYRSCHYMACVPVNAMQDVTDVKVVTAFSKLESCSTPVYIFPVILELYRG